MMNALKIIIWNANGLLSQEKRNEVKAFVIDEEIDVMLVSETHFTDINSFYIRGYITYSTNYPGKKARGGTAIIIRRGIGHHAIRGFRTKYLQATSIYIEEQMGGFVLSSRTDPWR